MPMPDRVLTGAACQVRAAPFLLSPRQAQSLSLAAKGLTVLAIARQMGISRRTVREYLQRSRRVLGAVNTTQAVAIAVARGLIEVGYE